MTSSVVAATSTVINWVHPSIRMKGTESQFSPVTCSNQTCKRLSVSHYHCPLCVQTKVHYDKRTVQIHFSLQHIDKGIEHAGLKILRCCRHCNLIGASRSSKRFVTGHWHCFKCKRGFGRRIEAITHYKLHTRNATAPLQLYICEDVNISNEYQELEKTSALRKEPSQPSCTPVILEGSEVSLTNDAETVQEIIPSEAVEPDFQTRPAKKAKKDSQSQESEKATINGTDPENSIQSSVGPGSPYLELEVKKLQQELAYLTEEKLNVEIKLKTEIQYLKYKLKSQADEINRLRKQKCIRCLPRNSYDEGKANVKIEELLEQLKQQHSQLLTEQLVKIQNGVYSTVMENIKNVPGVPTTSERFLLPNNICESIVIVKQEPVVQNLAEQMPTTLSQLSSSGEEIMYNEFEEEREPPHDIVDLTS